MVIRDFSSARHLSSRLEMGIDDTLCKSRIGAEIEEIFTTMLPVEGYAVAPPVLADWGEMAAFYGAEVEVQREIRMQARTDANTLIAWWLEHIHRTDYPLLERMTLFWHNHFTSNIDKVNWPQFMLVQNQLLRKHALGNFADLLRDIIRDPAMLMFLDNAQNLAKSPNENFARELLELFTLGVGNYSEADVVNAARAFTGWRVDLKKGEFLFQAGFHDEGEKVFRGQRANLDGDDIVDLLLQEARTAEHIAERFWFEFVNRDTPDLQVIQSWAAEFRESGYEIKALLRAIILSEAFWDEQNRGALIKSPVEFTVGMMRELNISLNDYESLRKANRQLGQELLRPPDVKGWRGGNDWITNTRLIRRYDLISKLLAEHAGDTGSMLTETVLKSRMRKTEAGDEYAEQFGGVFRNLLYKVACFANEGEIIRWLLPLEPISLPNCEQPMETMLVTLLKDPTYQLR